MSEQEPTFVRDELIDEPGIAGASWWNRSVEAATKREVNRRGFLTVLGIGVSTVVIGGAAVACLTGDDTTVTVEPSLQVQRTHGWAFDAWSRLLTIPAGRHQLADLMSLASLRSTLRPERFLEQHSETLLESLNATPTMYPSDPEVVFQPLSQRIQSYGSPVVEQDQALGAELARLLLASPQPVLLVLDLAGLRTVAFAAGAATAWVPVLGFENWPHPLGVVQAHLALGVALDKQTVFEAARSQRTASAPPMLLLDRGRTAAYRDDVEAFDNRWVARLPAAPMLRTWGVTRALYVVERAADMPEPDDLNPMLSSWASAGLEVRALSVESFAEGLNTMSRNGLTDPHWVWKALGWIAADPATDALLPALALREWRAVYRVPTPSPAHAVGTTNVSMSSEGQVLGLAVLRSGSSGRSGGGWSWGG